MDNPSIKWGLFYGIASIALMLIFYLIDPKLIFSVNGYIGFVLMIVFPILACRDGRILNGGFASFGNMFTTAFMTLIVGALVGTVFQFVFMNFIAPEMIDIQREISIEAMEKMGGFMGEEKMEEAIEGIQNSNPLSIGKIVVGFLFIAFIAAIISAIIGAIMQKKDPSQF